MYYIKDIYSTHVIILLNSTYPYICSNLHSCYYDPCIHNNSLSLSLSLSKLKLCFTLFHLIYNLATCFADNGEMASCQLFLLHVYWP